MINITKLYCGVETSGDPIRYGHPTKSQEYQVPPSARERRPVTVWGATRRCNLAASIATVIPLTGSIPESLLPGKPKR